MRKFLNTPENFTGGKIREFKDQWKEVTESSWVFSVIEGVSIDHKQVEFIPDKHEINFEPDMHEAMSKEVTKLLDKKVIEKVCDSEDQVVSNIFGRMKKDGSTRVILNLKEFNKQFDKIHFKMESLNDAINLMTEGCFFGSIDLKDAYFSINISEHSRKFFRFRFDNILYQFIGLPQGYKDSPRIFTKVMLPVLGKLREKGHKLVGYIDDFCVKAETRDACINSLHSTSNLFDELGFTVHPEKSQFVPSNRITFLGFVLDSIKMEVAIGDEKARDTINLIQQFLGENQVTIRQFAKVVGTLVALDPGNAFGSIFWRRLDIEKGLNLKLAKGDFDVQMVISHIARQDLNWWLSNIQNYPVKVKDRFVETITITTDASLSGWGAVLGDISTGGLWSVEENSAHINELELRTIWLALQAFCDQEKKKNIVFYTDNSTALACVNKKGSNKSNLNDITRLIWLFAIQRDLWIKAVFIPGIENVLADSESRKIRQVEWKLNPIVFKKLYEMRGPFYIDLFASRISHQISKFVSWLPDPEAWKIDAFSLDWDMVGIYCFPPFCLILRILHRVILQQADMMIIVPMWKQRPWYPQLIDLLVDFPIILPKTNIILDPAGKAVMTGVNWNLIACSISGKDSKRKAFQERLERLSSQAGESPLTRHIDISLGNTLFSATNRDGMLWIKM